MKSLKDVLGKTNGSARFSQKVVATQLCPHGNETLELRETVKINSDGTKDVQRQWTECLCEMVRQAQTDYFKLKLQKYDKYTTYNPALEKATLENFNYQDSPSQYEAALSVSDFVKNFSVENGKKLYFYGKVGTGKSHLAMGIHKKVIAKGFSSIFMEMDKFLRIIKGTWSNNDETEAEFFKVLQDVDLLVIDDLGAENNSSDWVQEKLFSIFNSRIGKNTVITSNISPEDLEKHYNERIEDRIFDGLDIDNLINIKIESSYRKKQLLQKLQQKQQSHEE